MPLLAEILDLQRRYAEADRIYDAAFDAGTSSGVINGEMHRDYGLMLLRRGDTLAPRRSCCSRSRGSSRPTRSDTPERAGNQASADGALPADGQA